MKERKIEVEHLKQRINELEGSVRPRTTFNAGVAASPSTAPNALEIYGRELNNSETFASGNSLSEYTHKRPMVGLL
jgi:hypothetical protein